MQLSLVSWSQQISFCAGTGTLTWVTQKENWLVCISSCAAVLYAKRKKMMPRVHFLALLGHVLVNRWSFIQFSALHLIIIDKYLPSFTAHSSRTAGWLGMITLWIWSSVDVRFCQEAVISMTVKPKSCYYTRLANHSGELGTLWSLWIT